MITVVVMVGKVSTVTVATFLAGRDVRTSVRTAMSLSQIGEFSFIIVGVGVASGAIGDHLLPIAVAVSAITTLATPALIAASGAVAERIDRGLPAPLQTFVALYGSWFETLRRSPVPHQERSRERRLFRLLALDVAILLAIVIAAAVEMPRGTALLARWIGARESVAQLLVLTVAAVAAAPLVLGLFRTAGALGASLAERALPVPAHGADFGFAPRRALSVALQGAIALVSGMPVVAITQPFLPPLRGAAVLLLLVLVIGALLWRSAANLQGTPRQGRNCSCRRCVTRWRPPRRIPCRTPSRSPSHTPSSCSPAWEHPWRWSSRRGTPPPVTRLRELNVRARTGAAVLAITRGDARILVPRGHDAIAAGDVLALAGTADAVAAAIRLLTGDNGVSATRHN